MHEPVPGACPPTHWSMVLAAGDDTSPGASEALEHLCSTYREPVFRYLSGCGIPPGEVEDIVQSFFESLLRRRSFSRVAPERGRFRAYLKRALRYHLLDRPKPIPREKVIELDALEPGQLDGLEPGDATHPGDALDREWAEHVLHLALERLEARCRDSGEDSFVHLRRFLAEEPEPGDYAVVAQAAGISANTVAKRVQRLREELNHCVREILIDTVGTPAEVEIEIRALFA